MPFIANVFFCICGVENPVAFWFVMYQNQSKSDVVCLHNSNVSLNCEKENCVYHVGEIV